MKTNLLVKILQLALPQGCGNTHWWDPAACYRCLKAEVRLVTVDHNDEIQGMWCSPEHNSWPASGRWRTVELSSPILNGTWRQVERARAQEGVTA